MLNEDVIRWKLDGEEMLKASGVPYTIVQAYAPPPRPWNDPDPKEFNIAILQGKGSLFPGIISRSDLGHVAVEALIRPGTENTTFQAINARKDLPEDTVAVILKADPKFPDWKGSLDNLAKDAPATKIVAMSK